MKEKEQHKPRVIGPNKYKDCTREELENLLLQAQELENQGIPMTETIVKVEKALGPKVDSGIIYEDKG